MVFTGTLKNVEFFKIEEMVFIYGIIVEHKSNRWVKGDWFCSSLLRKVDEKCLVVITQNSLYKVDNISAPIILCEDQWGLVRQGVSPREIIAIESKLQSKKY